MFVVKQRNQVEQNRLNKCTLELDGKIVYSWDNSEFLCSSLMQELGSSYESLFSKILTGYTDCGDIQIDAWEEWMEYLLLPVFSSKVRGIVYVYLFKADKEVRQLVLDYLNGYTVDSLTDKEYKVETITEVDSSGECIKTDITYDKNEWVYKYSINNAIQSFIQYLSTPAWHYKDIVDVFRITTAGTYTRLNYPMRVKDVSEYIDYTTNGICYANQCGLHRDEDIVKDVYFKELPFYIEIVNGAPLEKAIPLNERGIKQIKVIKLKIDCYFSPEIIKSRKNFIMSQYYIVQYNTNQ